MFTITDPQSKVLLEYLEGKNDVPNLVNTLRDELRDHVKKVRDKEARMMRNELHDYVNKKFFFYNATSSDHDIHGIFRGMIQVKIQNKPFWGIEIDMLDSTKSSSFWKRLKHMIVPQYKRVILLPSHGSIEDMARNYYNITIIFVKLVSRDEWITTAFPPNTSVTIPDNHHFIFFSPIWQGHHILNYLATSPLNDVVSMSGVDDKDAVAILCRSVYGSSPVAHHIAELIKSEQWKEASIALQAELTKQRQSLFKQIPDLKDGDCDK